MSIHYTFNTKGVTICQNGSGLTFFLLGQPPCENRPGVRGIISTGGLN